MLLEAGTRLPAPVYSEYNTHLRSNDGCLPFNQKIQKFRLKVKLNSNFAESPFGIVDYLQRKSSFSVRDGTAEISLPSAKFSSFQSLISRKQLCGKSNFKWQAPSRSVGLLILENPLPLFNGHPNRFILTNGKHPRSQVHVDKYKIKSETNGNFFSPLSRFAMRV